jgi:poly-gamma-glutamate capsule biosynthesis protein CapA/YwtB (metallophosphatase superfamily)
MGSMPTDDPTIALLGDVMLGRKVAERLAEAPPGTVWSDEVAELFGACEAVVCNLECCVSEHDERTTRIPGKPFFFRAPPSATEALAAVGVTAASLANNHALDFGTVGLLDTLDHLAAASIAAVGAGPGVDRARRGTIVPAGELRLGLLAATDHPEEFGAGAGSPGVAFADLRAGLPEWIRSELARLRAEADVVIAFPHWGPNMTSEPAGWQQARARELVAAGADLVAGHSAHVFHGIGWVGEHPVMYDLGGALDDYAVDAELRNDLGVAGLWRPLGEPRLELVGLELRYCETVLASGAAADWIAARLESACAPFGTRLERNGEGRFVALLP